jgi:hypothetical protein
MSHLAKIVPGSLRAVGMALVFTVRCCDDPKTDFHVTLNDAHKYTPDDVKLLKDQALRKRVAAHENTLALMKHLE